MMRRNVVLVAMLCAAGTALAQTPPANAPSNWQAQRHQWQQKWHQERAQMERRRMERLAVLLDMTSAQRQQVDAIFSAEHARARQALREAMAARRAARADALTKLGQVLSPTQMKKLKLLMPERGHRLFMMRGRMCMSGMGMWPPHPGAAMGPPPQPPSPPGGAGPQ